MAFNQRRARRRGKTINKNDLKISRVEAEERRKTEAGTLRTNFPHVLKLQIHWRLTSPFDAMLGESSGEIGLDEALLLDVPCHGQCCGNGVFHLRDLVERLLRARTESHEGSAVCQAASYADARVPCNTRLNYRVTADFAPEPEAPQS